MAAFPVPYAVLRILVVLIVLRVRVSSEWSLENSGVFVFLLHFVFSLSVGDNRIVSDRSHVQ